MQKDNRNTNPTNLPGTRSNFTRPLILELFAKGQGKEVLQLLYSVGLEVAEIQRPPWFRITQRR